MLRITSAVRRAVARPGEIGATEPLEFHSTLGPTETIPGSGGGPSHGPTTRTSTPSLRSSRARPSTWPCTPPGRESEYGEVITTRTLSRSFRLYGRIRLARGGYAASLVATPHC